jgi:hypothetical protein
VVPAQVGTGEVAAQGTTQVLTLAAADGGLWAAPSGSPPRLLRANVAQGSQISGLAWHPTRPEVLLVRRSIVPEHNIHPDVPVGPPEPFDTLVRLDPTSGAEQVLI